MATDDLRRIAQGREAEIFAWEDEAVLRLLRGAGDDRLRRLEWEAAAMEAARACGVPVPAVRGLTTVGGRPGLIMDRLDGPDLLTLVGRRPWTVWRAGKITGELHARLHAVPAPASLPSLHDQLRAAAARVPADMAHLARITLRRLEALPDGEMLLHGDFHPGNVLVHDGRPCIIDWPNVTRGDPDADLARSLLLLRLGEPPPGSPLLIRVMAVFARSLLIDAYARAYRRVRPYDEAQVRRWMLVCAGDRLEDGIESERAKLIRMIESED